MLRTSVFLLLLLLRVHADHYTTIENTNYTLSMPMEGDQALVNYNRLRIKDDFQEGPWFTTVTLDAEHYLGREFVYSTYYESLRAMHPDVPFHTISTGNHRYGEGDYFFELYRLYGGYMDSEHRISAGLQKISMGVGRIWNPTDLFNPKNPLAVEPDEVFGVFALSYTYSFAQTGEASAVIAQRENSNLKFAGRFKNYWEGTDTAINLIHADNLAMIGYEVEGEWRDLGMGWRSEGGWFEDKELDQSFFQAIAGADYRFDNDVIVMAEWLYSSQRFNRDEIAHSAMPGTLWLGKHYGAISAIAEIDALWSVSAVMICNMEDESCFASPSVEYSYSDDTTIGIGMMGYAGGDGDEFGDQNELYYLRLKMTF